MVTDQRPRRREDFRIAVLCALPLEYNAASLAFDEFFDEDGDKFGRARGDPNRYTTGRIGKYNVVMALLPGMGTISSASAMASFRSSYTELKLALLVGICGGVPSPGTEKEILLGDVIISKTVVQYDFGRQNPHHFATKDTLSDSLGRPNKDIRSLLASLETERTFERLERRTAEILTGIQQTAAQAGRKRTRYPYPGAAQDGLFSPTYEHRHRDDADCGCDDTWICDTAPDASCMELECDKSHLVLRESLEMKKKLEREGNTAEAQEPHILIGSVGSGNAVMKSGAHRDEIAQRYELIAFEMEAAGAWDEVPCVVIKGVCDYADSHKNKKWQTFAAATAASSMKALLELYTQTDSPGNSRLEFSTQRINEILTWISKEPYEQHHTLNKSEVLEGTGKWLLKDEVFQSWKNSEASSILWLHGIPGSGKSKLTSIVVEDALQSSPAATVYFYCSRNPAEPGRSNPTSIIASIARQLAMPQPGADILDAAAEAYKKFEEKAFASHFLTLGESQQLTHRLLDNYEGQKITLIIDALDECNRDTRQDLLDFLVSLLKAPTTMKVFVSSRDDRDIVNELDQYENLYLSSERNSGDIELFVRSETTRLVKKGSLLRGSSRRQELRRKIIYELISNAHGMFRWASLHIQELCRQATDAAIEERLVKMPRTLEGLYQEILEKIENRDAVADREMATNAFRWLLCAQEQFGSSVFLEMVSKTKEQHNSTISKDQLLELCNNMILFDETLDAFRFSHLSVREFLEGQHAYRRTAAHAFAAEHCLLSLVDLPSRIVPLAPLLHYSTFFWADHAKQADHDERQSRLFPILTNFFSGEQSPSSSFSRWYNFIVSKDLGVEPDTVKREKFEKATSYQPSILLIICAFDLSGVLGTERWRELAQMRPMNLNGATHEELVLRCGSIRVLQWHCDAGLSFQVSKKDVEWMASFATNAAEMMALLLERFAAETQITKEVLVATVSNKECGDKVLALLLEKRGYEIEMTDAIFKAAVLNKRKAVQVASLLLKQYKSQIRITPDIVIAAISNGPDILKLLLDERGDEMEISADTLLIAAREHNYHRLIDFRPVLMLLLKERRNQIRITADFIIDIARAGSFSSDGMALLLDECEDEMRITTELVYAIWGNYSGRNEIMSLFIDELGAKSQISDELTVMIVGRFNGATVRNLLDMDGNSMKVSTAIVKAAARNSEDGREVMSVLLDEYGDDIQITEDVVEAVFANDFGGYRIMGLLLDERPHEIRINEEFVRMAVQSNPDMLALILEKCRDQISITDDIIQLCSDGEMIAMIVETLGYEIQITEKILICAAAQHNGIFGQDDGLLQLLLDTRMEEIRLTECIISAAAANSAYGLRFMRLLLDRYGDDIVITKQILMAAASNFGCGGQMMALLLKTRRGRLRITESVVEAAAKNRQVGHKVVAVISAGWNGSIPITEKALVHAAENDFSGDKVMESLLVHGGEDVQITEGVVNVAVQNLWCGSATMAILLEKYDDDLPVTDETVRLAASNKQCGDEIIALLLEKCRGDVRITGEILKAAALNEKCGHRVMAAILEACRNIDDVDTDHCGSIQNALYEASSKGNADTVQVLLANKANINAEGGRYGNALQVASRFGHPRVVRMLLINNAQVNTQGGRFGHALQAASVVGHLQVVRMLLHHNAEINAKGGLYNTALQAASRWGHEEIVQLLLQNNADVNAQGGKHDTALYGASANGHYGIVKMLLLNNADVNIQGAQFGNALQAASFSGHLKIAQLLLENGADASRENGFYGGSLQAASAGGHVELVSLLHDEYNVGMDCSNGQFSRTALSYAAGSGNSSVVQLLLAYADVRPFSEDHISRTPLFYAAQSGHAEIVRILAERNPSAVDWKDHYGSTPLSVAARKGYIKVVRILLASYGVDIDSRDCFGRTPLCWATKRNLYDMACLLETAKKGDLPLDDSEPWDTSSQLSWDDGITQNDPSWLDCGICVLSIEENDDTYYQCPVCNGGEFYICKECFDDCACCLVASHELTPKLAKDI